MFYSTIFQSARFRRLSIEGFWVILGQVMSVLGSLASVRLLTELLTPVEYGELALGMTVATLVSQTLLGPLGNGVTRFYAPAQEKGELGGFLHATLRLVSSATGLVVLIIIMAVACLLFANRSEWIPIVTTAFIFAILSGYSSILSGIQNAARQRAIVALHQGMEAWVRFFSAASLILLLGPTSAVAMAGYTLAVTLVLGSQTLFFRKLLPKHLPKANKKIIWQGQIWSYSWPFFTWGLFVWAQLASDRWALQFFATSQDVGRYVVLYQLGYYPISIATGTIVQLLAPIFFQRAGDAGDRHRNENVNNLSWRLTWLALGVTGSTFLVAMTFHAQIFRIIAAKQYWTVSPLLPWVILAGGVFAAGQTIALSLMSQMKTRSMAAAKIVTAVLGFLCNFAGAYSYGTQGVVMANVIFSLLYFSWMALLSKKAGY